MRKDIQKLEDNWVKEEARPFQARAFLFVGFLVGGSGGDLVAEATLESQTIFLAKMTDRHQLDAGGDLIQAGTVVPGTTPVVSIELHVPVGTLEVGSNELELVFGPFDDVVAGVAKVFAHTTTGVDVVVLG